MAATDQSRERKFSTNTLGLVLFTLIKNALDPIPEIFRN
jgi:hypothetical protein